MKPSNLAFARHLLAATSIAAAAVAMPVTLTFGTADQGISITASKAFAKDGRSGGDDSGGSDDSGGRGRGRGGDDSADNSGSGSQDSGRGRGRGRGGDDGGHGADDGPNHDAADDSSGRGRGRGRGRGDNPPGLGFGRTGAPGHYGAHHFNKNGVKVEVEGNDIEIVLPNGWKEELENGIYELKDPAGRTVAERLATAEDIARMKSFLQ